MAEFQARGAGGGLNLGGLAAWGGLVLAVAGWVYAAGWQGAELRHNREQIAFQAAALTTVRMELRSTADALRTEMRASDRTLFEMRDRMTRVETTLQGLDTLLRDFLQAEEAPRRKKKRAG